MWSARRSVNVAGGSASKSAALVQIALSSTHVAIKSEIRHCNHNILPAGNAIDCVPACASVSFVSSCVAQVEEGEHTSGSATSVAFHWFSGLLVKLDEVTPQHTMLNIL